MKLQEDAVIEASRLNILEMDAAMKNNKEANEAEESRLIYEKEEGERIAAEKDLALIK